MPFFVPIALASFEDRTDSSGIRFYLGNELRQHDIGYLTFGTDSSAAAIAIPPHADKFIIDSYCPSEITSVEFFHRIEK